MQTLVFEYMSRHLPLDWVGITLHCLLLLDQSYKSTTTKIGFGDLTVVKQGGARAFERDPSGFQHVRVVGNGQSNLRVLLDEENRRPCFIDYLHDCHDLVYDNGRK